MTNVNIDTNASNNISVWSGVVQSGKNVGLASVYAKIGGEIHVLRGSLQHESGARQLAWDIFKSDGVVNMIRWARVGQHATVQVPIMQVTQPIVAVDLKENGNPNCGSIKGQVFACVGGSIYIHEGGRADSVALAKGVRKAGKINLNHWKLTK